MDGQAVHCVNMTQRVFWPFFPTEEEKTHTQNFKTQKEKSAEERERERERNRDTEFSSTVPNSAGKTSVNILIMYRIGKIMMQKIMMETWTMAHTDKT